MESLSYEQLLAEIDQPNERELYAEIQKIGLNGYLLKNTPKEILTKFLPSILCHLQFETWLHRLNSKFNNQQPINQTDNQLIVNIDYNQFDQPTTSGLSSIQITNSNSSNIPPTITVADTNVIQNDLEIQTSSNDQIEEDLWPAVFKVPAEKLDDVLLESLRDVDVILSKKDRSDIVNVLFKQILSYKKLYPSGFQYREAAKSFGIRFPNFGNLRHMKKMQYVKQIITCPLADIRDANKKIFTNRIQLDVDERNVLNELKEHLDRVESDSPKFKLEYGEMKDVISTLKNGKSSGMSNISNEMIKYCDSKLLIKTLQICYGKMIEYSRVPTNFNISIIKPLIKDHKSPSNTINNLRPVAISDVYSVMFEKILLGRIKLESKEHDKQFGFKQNSSCAHAVFILKQVMNLCKQKKRSLYVLAVDLTKFSGLFYVVIELDDERSDVFRTLLGVKQGGPSSPTLFNFIAHQVIVEIEQLGIGVTVGKQLVNIIGYADDTLLIANKSSDMIKMIRVLEETTKKNEIEINVKKTFMMSTDKSNLVFNIFGNKIENTTQIKYLGSEISMNGTAKVHVGKRRIELQFNKYKDSFIEEIESLLKVKRETSLDSLDLQVERELNKNEAESAEFRCSSLMVIRVKEILLIQSPRVRTKELKDILRIGNVDA
ncbi:RNA-directed DNA polymerase from mobile element jockey-like [Brachionus plicatilis]|uniref:RNA-directed DNA polymerase from mobile element jockey-like n=1 Tax=Brachionus plicatilis TaxID=10195 RepID=A0A3M7T5N2_BRAPC|nr:RNA-directed DNA polymerase from mobile element jockey-like [Brachionus plicatilis]